MTLAAASFLLALLLALGSSEDDGVAPANRWHTFGGSAARTGAAKTAPVRQPVEVVWRHEAGGEIEGEPLVWDDWVLLAIRRAPDHRVLRAIDLLTGEPLVPDRVVRSEFPLEPSIWRNVVIYRAAANLIVGARLGARRFDQVWSWRGDKSLGPPLVVGSEVYVAEEDALRRLTVGRSRPAWSLDGRFRGRISLQGNDVYALGYDPVGKAFVRKIDRARGVENAALYVGHHGGELPSFDSEVDVHLLSAGLFAHFARPLEVVTGRDIHYVGIDPFAPQTSTLEPLPGSIELLQAPAAWREAWLGAIVDGDGERTFVLKRDSADLELRVLATGASNADFLPDRLPVTTAGSVGFVGARAFDLETSRVLWRLPLRASSRVVPARETALVVEEGVRLTAIRTSAGKGGVSTKLTAPELVQEGRLVLREGSIEEGTFGVDVRAGHVGRLDGKASPWRVEDVLLLEDADRSILLGTDVVRGVEALIERELAGEYARLAKKARGANDVELLEELILAAWLHGADEKDLDAARRTADALHKRAGVARRTLANEIRAEAAALDGLPAEAFWQRASALDAEAPDRWLVALLRATLQAEPQHDPAVELVRELVPEELRRAGDTEVFDAEDWLAFVEATRASPIRVLRPPTSEQGIDESQRVLLRATQTWRGDLLGFESEHLLILTPVRRPGALARCLSMGELVCSALRETFASGDVERDSRRPLVLHLYETKEEYLAHGPDGGGEGGAGLSWTAGHYDQHANVSRIFVPERGDAFDSVMETYAHEITHHWLRMQCPMFPFKPMELADATQPGYWVVEGFASFVDEFRFDVARGTWHSESPQSRRLDLVANAGAGQIVEWKDVYGLSHLDFSQMSFEGEPAIPSRCYLGLRHVVSARHMFYAQAAATCRFLFEAEGGRYRGALLDYVKAFYTNERAALDVVASLGMTPDELGRAVVAWSRQTLGMSGSGR